MVRYPKGSAANSNEVREGEKNVLPTEYVSTNKCDFSEDMVGGCSLFSDWAKLSYYSYILFPRLLYLARRVLSCSGLEQYTDHLPSLFCRLNTAFALMASFVEELQSYTR